MIILILHFVKLTYDTGKNDKLIDDINLIQFVIIIIAILINIIFFIFYMLAKYTDDDSFFSNIFGKNWIKIRDSGYNPREGRWWLP